MARAELGTRAKRPRTLAHQTSSIRIKGIRFTLVGLRFEVIVSMAMRALLDLVLANRAKTEKKGAANRPSFGATKVRG